MSSFVNSCISATCKKRTKTAEQLHCIWSVNTLYLVSNSTVFGEQLHCICDAIQVYLVGVIKKLVGQKCAPDQKGLFYFSRMSSLEVLNFGSFSLQTAAHWIV